MHTRLSLLAAQQGQQAATAADVKQDAHGQLALAPKSTVMLSRAHFQGRGRLPVLRTAALPSAALDAEAAQQLLHGMVHGMVHGGRAVGPGSTLGSACCARLCSWQRCVVYRDLWRRGFFLTQGQTFGADYLAYPGTSTVPGLRSWAVPVPVSTKPEAWRRPALVLPRALPGGCARAAHCAGAGGLHQAGEGGQQERAAGHRAGRLFSLLRDSGLGRGALQHPQALSSAAR